MSKVDVLPGAQADLKALKQAELDAWATIMVVLEEFDADPKVIEKLTTHGDVEFGDLLLNIKGWVEARRLGNNLFRFRVLDSPATKYRAIYGYDWRVRRIGVLAIVKKDGNTYQISSELAQRIIDEWRTATGGAAT